MNSKTNVFCPQCGEELIPTTKIMTDGKTQDGQNYMCRKCRSDKTQVSHWHRYNGKNKLEVGTVQTAY